ncbi:hypothetical protein HOLleu_01805 [Holothuria leucospilota]|uniref:Endonuclease/exonuclease/phosphatase domain-containing protein n=1 Tax=Holothuria leucospilota TaxID=206669 RepID=A0A9Q1HGN2_HOLLE|nr:hypothetical protein HOLleu_01805 [Holothuria leucospilota]
MNVAIWALGFSILFLSIRLCLGESDEFLSSVRTSYSSAELHALRSQPIHNVYLFSNTHLPNEIRRRKRGKPGGVKKRMRRRKCKPYLHSIITGNVQSLSNKIDEICANCKFLHEFRNATKLSFTETWLTDLHSDAHISIDGFNLLRGDRTVQSGKGKGECVCIYVNEKWCHPNNAVMKWHSCTENIETLTVSLRPYYLKREFSHVIVHTVYVPNRSVSRPAGLELADIIHEVEAAAPDALTIINGDFNHCITSGKAVFITINMSSVLLGIPLPWIYFTPMLKTHIFLFNYPSLAKLTITLLIWCRNTDPSYKFCSK